MRLLGAFGRRHRRIKDNDGARANFVSVASERGRVLPFNYIFRRVLARIDPPSPWAGQLW